MSHDAVGLVARDGEQVSGSLRETIIAQNKIRRQIDDVELWSIWSRGYFSGIYHTPGQGAGMNCPEFIEFLRSWREMIESEDERAEMLKCEEEG